MAESVCPECTEKTCFSTPEEVYRHAATEHYGSQMTNLYLEDFLSADGHCKYCPDVEFATSKTYVEHVGGFHRAIHKFMTDKLMKKYLKLIDAPIERELLDDGAAKKKKKGTIRSKVAAKNAPKRGRGKKESLESPHENTSAEEAAHVFVSSAGDEFMISEIEVQSHKIDPSVLQAVEDEVNKMMAESGNLFQLSGSEHSNNPSPVKAKRKRARPPKKASPDGCDTEEWSPSKKSKSQSKNKRRGEKVQTTGKYKCPECSFRANQVSSIHTHSARSHYYAQLTELYKNWVMLDKRGFCSECPDRHIKVLNDYVHHVGGKHNLFLQCVTPELAQAYGKLPSKKNNSGYIKNDLQKSLKCLICPAEKPFINVTQYKQHLSIIHYVHDIARSYKSTFPSHWMNKTCALCGTTKKYSRGEALLTHLGSKHNFFLDYANDRILEQLKPFNVVKH